MSLTTGKYAFLVLMLVTATVHAETLRGRVIDAQSKAPLPCRLYVQGSDGAWYFAKSSDAAGSSLKYSVEREPKSFEKHVTLSAHPFEVEVPPGQDHDHGGTRQGVPSADQDGDGRRRRRTSRTAAWSALDRYAAPAAGTRATRTSTASWRKCRRSCSPRT